MNPRHASNPERDYLQFQGEAGAKLRLLTEVTAKQTSSFGDVVAKLKDVAQELLTSDPAMSFESLKEHMARERKKLITGDE
eukprot:87095-Amphidinium_carterae.1